MATVNSRLEDTALEWADQQLDRHGHQELTIAAVAEGCGRKPPSLHKAYGSLLGFHAALAVRQWERANMALDAADGSPLGLALADVAFAIDHPHRFRLMYAAELWTAATGPTDVLKVRERIELELMEKARDENFRRFFLALGGKAQERRVRLVASLLTGLSFEFVNERLHQGNRMRQLKEAEALLRMVIEK